jgi:hypothetical protein
MLSLLLDGSQVRSLPKTNKESNLMRVEIEGYLRCVSAFHICEKIPDKNNLKEVRFILAHDFKGLYL